ncbi:N-formylglutamate amidohydrolase [Ruegeria pomeroyi]|uniref:N-formylglutamate amidohydrolase n=1 Tax=Ruegeria alba TaxID=2916756 RepID=A0ABS9P0E5_9RHOB|nr:N-formylglutamate amidohydrolase [Ruegeria alba]MCE8523176.1 N-formylglutamate amidohydrolase [Ruegeria pomeroyi]MCE8527278.1 N-formylglutamate amidohydrolase [Ruegeria pomeroyi]MCG6559958.1 N-formylglutamate amidohydrolase [Ruegeria alba]
MTYTPFFIHGEDRRSRWLITCDHATNTVPPDICGGDLGLAREDMERHIAYDVGAYEVSRLLGEMLEAPVIAANFSRLVIDPNRGEDDPTLLMKLYDGSIIPGNRHADAAERERRLNMCYRPYHNALAQLASPPGVVLVSMHSFTRQLRGREPRPWHVGVLHTADRRFSDPLIARLQAERDLCVGVNQPYTGVLPGDAIDTHCTAFGRPNALIELRNDLIGDHAGQHAWAERLVPILQGALVDSGL